MPPRNSLLPEAATDSAREARNRLFCDLCNKGYSRVDEYQRHLDSLDHTHRQRLKDTQRIRQNALAAGYADDGLGGQMKRIALPQKQDVVKGDTNVPPLPKKKKPVFKTISLNKSAASAASTTTPSDAASHVNPLALGGGGDAEEALPADITMPAALAADGDELYDPLKPSRTTLEGWKELLSREIVVVEGQLQFA